MGAEDMERQINGETFIGILRIDEAEQVPIIREKCKKRFSKIRTVKLPRTTQSDERWFILIPQKEFTDEASDFQEEMEKTFHL